MKRLLTLLLTLAAGAAILLGFTLPWLVTGWQDRQNQGELLRYEAPQVRLDAEADLFQRLALVSGDPSMVALTTATTRHSQEEAAALVTDTLNTLASYKNLTIFASDRWFLQNLHPFLVTARYDTVQYDSDSNSWTASATSQGRAALIWKAVLATTEGERLTLLVDDDLGLMLSFTYTYSDSASARKDNYVVVDLSQGLADLLAGFCRDYYQLSSAQALAVSNGSWQLLLVNAASEKLTVPLSATAAGDLLFNAQDN